ncbi:MAG: DUF222 domain-containing protein [Ilumatobacteraceae bacterium]
MDTDVEVRRVERPLEQLEALIWQGAANLSAAECEWLLAVAEFDRREGWVSWECRSCAAWLSWQVGLDIRAAREKVRVARALEVFPLVRAAMAAGRLSYSKVRAITRIAAAETEQMLVDLALAATTHQVERIVTGYRRSEDVELASEQEQQARRRLTHQVESDGSVTIKVRLPAAEAARVLAAVDAAVAPAKDDDGQYVPLDVRRVDALVEVVTAGGAASELIHVHVDAEVLAGGHGRCDVEPVGDSGLGPAPLSGEAVRRLLCDRPYVTVVHGADGGVVGVSARQRLVRGVRRRLVEQRDGGCRRVPGCARRGRLEVHHIVHRAHGGGNDPANLILLCCFHDHRVHEGGWTLEVTAGGDVELVGRDGRRITTRPVEMPAEPAAVHHRGRSPDDGRSRWAGDPLDLGLVTELLHWQRHQHSTGSADPTAA